MESDLEPGKIIDGFTLDEKLGEGGFAEVWKVFSNTNKAKVLKFPNSDCAEFIFKEAEASKYLEHENIIKVESVKKGGSLPYLLMEYFEGSNLREVMIDFSREEKINIIRQVGEALDYAHSQGVIHGDIKPENILVNEDLEVKICDFGLARILSNSSFRNSLKTSEKGICGTFGYIAPEIFEGKKHTEQSDIYSLSMVLLELFREKPLYSMTMALRELFEERPIGFKEMLENALDNIESNEGIKQIIKKGLDPDPENRYQSIDEFIENLDNNLNFKRKEVNDFKKSSKVGEVIGGLLGLALIAGVIYGGVYGVKKLFFKGKNKENDKISKIEKELVLPQKIQDFLRIHGTNPYNYILGKDFTKYSFPEIMRFTSKTMHNLLPEDRIGVIFRNSGLSELSFPDFNFLEKAWMDLDEGKNIHTAFEFYEWYNIIITCENKNNESELYFKIQNDGIRIPMRHATLYPLNFNEYMGNYLNKIATCSSEGTFLPVYFEAKNWAGATTVYSMYIKSESGEKTLGILEHLMKKSHKFFKEQKKDNLVNENQELYKFYLALNEIWYNDEIPPRRCAKHISSFMLRKAYDEKEKDKIIKKIKEKEKLFYKPK